MSYRKQLTRQRVVHKSTGGMLNSIPEPVDPVGNAFRSVCWGFKLEF